MQQKNMEIYLVGGAVRDMLLGLSIKDKDYVVVNSTAEEMTSLGYKSIGKDFPIFLHPETNEEYALARRNRNELVDKDQSFVTLNEDLSRRDLTINAIAKKQETGEIIDPYNGQEDILLKVLRHVSDVSFREDPIRILRIARFMARYTDFTIAEETVKLMTQMVNEGLVSNLVPERVWQELSRGLMECKPSRMLIALRSCGALKVILPELDVLWGIPQPAMHHPEIDTGIHIELAVDYSADCGYPLPVRWGVLMHDLGKGVTPSETWPSHHGHEGLGEPLVKNVCERLKVPTDCYKLAMMACREHGKISTVFNLRHTTIIQLLKRCDAFRKPERFEQLLKISECDFRGRGLGNNSFRLKPFHQPKRYHTALLSANTINASEIAIKFKGRESIIPEKIHSARVSAFKKAEEMISDDKM